MKGLKTMKTWKDYRKNKILAIVNAILWFMVLLFVVGCASNIRSSPRAIPHPLYGNEIILVPKGTDIGGIKAPADGLYIRGDRIIQIEPEQPPEPKQDKRFI